MSHPIRFAGTVEQASANYATHAFVSDECMFCLAKPWHVAANYPCGTEPPRAEDTTEADVAEQFARFARFAAVQ